MPEILANSNVSDSTQDVVTPNTSTNEVQGGKTFTQEEVNEIISKRINEINTKNKANTEDAVNKAIAEYERKAKLTKEERDKEERSKRELALKEREDNITLRERRLEAQEELRKNNVPIDLVDFVVTLDADKTKANIESLVKTYNKSVEDGITAKLKGNPPPDFSNSNEQDKKPVIGAF